MHTSARRLVCLSALASLAIVPVAESATADVAYAQAAADSSARHATIFGRDDAITAAAFVLATAAIMPLDRHIAVESQRSTLQNNSALSNTLTTFRVLGEPGSIILAGATYVYGRAGDSPRSAELGLRTAESIGAAGITSFILKSVTGRARPYVVSDSNPHDFKLGRGLGRDAYSSFPSGHVTTAFAAASAASQEISYLWPHASRLWTPLLFTSASLVGAARIYEDKHWASDVIAGAAVGTLVSRVVVRYERAHPRNALDRLLLPTGVSRGPSRAQTGQSVGFTWNYQW